MVKSKFLSLKTLNALNEVKIKPVMKAVVGETLKGIPEDCKANFLSKEMGYNNAFTVATHLNRELGYKAFVVKTRDKKQSYTVYHFSKETLEKYTEGYDDVVRI